VAYWFYILNPSSPALAASQRPLYQFLLNKWYFDELYDFLFVRPPRAGRFLWKGGDGAVIDGGINGLAMGIVPFFTRSRGGRSRATSSHYAFAMVIGIVVLITWMTIGGGGRTDGQPSFHRHLPAAGRRADPGAVPARRRRGGAENAKWLALSRPRDLPDLALHAVPASTRTTPASSSSRSASGCSACNTRWASTASRVLFVMLTTFLMPLTIAPAGA
jgi:hypothetical protein